MLRMFLWSHSEKTIP